MIAELVQASSGVALGVFIGAFLGLAFRRRSGKSTGLLAGSPFLTASAAGGAAMLVMMLITYMTGEIQ